MPVTIKTASHASKQKKKKRNLGGREATTSATSPECHFQLACPSEHRRSETIIQSSFNSEDLFSSEAPIYASSNGFVGAAVSAHCNHHHFTLRPEDVWFSILTQHGFFVSANAEDLRSFFVSREGKKELIVDGVDTLDFGAIEVRMTDLIAKNVVDPELRT
jgi:hypothetical protein